MIVLQIKKLHIYASNVFKKAIMIHIDLVFFQIMMVGE